jgi:hypothetical protein
MKKDNEHEHTRLHADALFDDRESHDEAFQVQLYGLHERLYVGRLHRTLVIGFACKIRIC